MDKMNRMDVDYDDWVNTQEKMRRYKDLKRCCFGLLGLALAESLLTMTMYSEYKKQPVLIKEVRVNIPINVPIIKEKIVYRDTPPNYTAQDFICANYLREIETLTSLDRTTFFNWAQDLESKINKFDVNTQNKAQALVNNRRLLSNVVQNNGENK